MKKQIALIVLALACVLALAGCACEHEWAEADCVNPKTCSKCQATEGTPLGHEWAAATCETAKTCETCGETEGEAKGHSMVEATCTEARHCEACELTEGEALGHTWLEATTEAPKTCETCGETEGERIVTDQRFTTEATREVQGKWSCIETMTYAEMGLEEGNETPVDFKITYTYNNDGSFNMAIRMADEEAFKAGYADWTLEMTYVSLEAEGMTREQVDQSIQIAFNMTTEEYVKSVVDELSADDVIASVFGGKDRVGIYYVENGQLVMGNDWDGETEGFPLTLDGDTMTIKNSDGSNLVFTRVAEEAAE